MYSRFLDLTALCPCNPLSTEPLRPNSNSAYLYTKMRVIL